MLTKVLEGSNKIEIWVLRVQFVTPNPNFMDDCKGKSLKIQPIDFSIIWCPIVRWASEWSLYTRGLPTSAGFLPTRFLQPHTEDPWQDDSVLLVLLMIPKMVSQGDCWAQPGGVVTTRSNEVSAKMREKNQDAYPKWVPEVLLLGFGSGLKISEWFVVGSSHPSY